ncbi:MAG: hypothetical protein F6K47_43915 [Symploca sp. SIO2E6]|nr:hypothetical protein [Symploca sp. SIO2E6]
MTPTPEDRLEAFIALIREQPTIFSAENRFDLDQQLDTFPEDIESLSNAISNWCLEHPDIFMALREKLNIMSDSTHGNFRGDIMLDSKPEDDRGSAESNPKPKPEDYKKPIKNRIRDSFPKTTQETKPSDSNK